MVQRNSRFVNFALSFCDLGTVYRNTRSSLYGKSTTALETDSIHLTKINKVTSYVNLLESSEKSKITGLITSAPFTGETQIHSSGTD